MIELENLLQEEQNRLAEKKRELQDQISEAKKQLHVVDVRLSHVSGLLGNNNVSEDDFGETVLLHRQEVTDIAVAILAERAREPVHFKELAKEVQARGGNLPGKNPANNLVARLVRDDRFVRPTQRGYYALSSDYPNVKSVGTRRRGGNTDYGQERNTVSISTDSPK